jgi:hypothetical protein
MVVSGRVRETDVTHTLSEEHVRWLMAESALNYIRSLGRGGKL